MIVIRFMVRSQPGAEEVMAALKDVVPPSRALDGVISFDIGRDVTDPDVFIATEVFEDAPRSTARSRFAKSRGRSESLSSPSRRNPKQRSSMSPPRSPGGTEGRVNPLGSEPLFSDDAMLVEPDRQTALKPPPHGGPAWL